ncbi:MAG: YdeI/OmpD-associated family protein [Bacteroidia bacterium]|nr:YdeI/OmpD-associated family protein [Bacteroidia bacterium]
MEITKALYFVSRDDWRQWLSENFRTEREIWLIYPNKSTGKPCILYNDAVEEALCFGWIDSTMKKYDETHAAQRFTPRNPKSAYSQPNKERLRWLADNNMLHPEILEKVTNILSEEFVYPSDIIAALQTDKETWQNFQQFSESYKRIRIAFVHDARTRPDIFEKRLSNLLKMTKQNKKIIGHGGVNKYY